MERRFFERGKKKDRVWAWFVGFARVVASEFSANLLTEGIRLLRWSNGAANQGFLNHTQSTAAEPFIAANVRAVRAVRLVLNWLMLIYTAGLS